jgi:CheY-like chemotaxis protein
MIMSDGGYSPQVLIVDDDAETLSGFSAILRAGGYRVRTAATGAAAFEALVEHAVDAAIVDLRLPDVSGLEVVHEARLRRPGAPVLVISGFATVSDAVRALRLGARDVLEKPVFEDELLGAVGRMLAASGVHAPGIPGNHAADQARASWVQALLPIIDSPKDPRTLSGWAELIPCPPSVLRSRCRAAGLTPRRALLFARLLRAVARRQDGSRALENFVDVVDRRTLAALLTSAGFDDRDDFPVHVPEFMARQRLVVDPCLRREVERALTRYSRAAGGAAWSGQTTPSQ